MKLAHIDREIAALFIATFSIALSITMLAPVIPEIKSEFGLTYTTASLVLSSFAVSRLLLSLPAGMLYEKFERKKLLMGSIAVLSFGSFLAGTSKDFITFLAAQMIMGAGFSVCFMTVLVSLSAASKKENRGRMLGMNSFARSLGAIIAPTFAGAVAVAFGWRSVFLSFTLISLVSLFALYFMVGKKKVAETREIQEKEPKNYRQTLYGLFAIMFITNLVFAGFRGNAIPLYAGDVLKLNAGDIGFMLSLSAIVFLLCAPLSAYLSDRHGRKVFIVTAMLALVLSVFGFLVAGTYTRLLVVMAVFGYGSIVFVSSTAMLGDITHQRQASRNYSMLRFISDLGMVAGPLAAGFVLDHYGFRAASWVFGIFSFLAFVIALYFLEEPKFRVHIKKFLNLATFGRLGN